MEVTRKQSKPNFVLQLPRKDFSDNRKFWKTTKPYFSNKGLNSNKFIESIFNSYFTNITSSLENSN